LRHKRRFPYLNHGAADALAIRHVWHSRRFPRLSWHLVPGNFREVLTQAPAGPDFIFYDMFSSKTHGDEWTLAAFQSLLDALQEKPCALFTYSTSTAVRAALLAAGWHVARGAGTGVKTETTIALTPAAAPGPWPRLGASWLARWERSHVQYP
ncbi:MnmC family methyltransferase, partial [Bradyrhizobium sp. NBAIM08]|uniref:MnmC family methyltransferase n=1 Tax=Bradyrhizobium sp. NBAIM08 TaxID=2793815 RepID=UPI001CD4335D